MAIPLLFVVLLIASPTWTLAQSTPVASPITSTTTWWRESVCYEIFVRSFYDSDGDGIGDFRGLIEKLDYLNDGDAETTSDLGIGCIWLMPIMESVSYHGYDVTDYYNVEQDYGDREDFLALMDAADQRGIRVIIDFEFNHSSSEHPWFTDAASDPNSLYRDWYTFESEDPGYSSPWGAPAWHANPLGDGYFYGIFWEGMPDLNLTNPEVTTEIETIAEFWLTEMRVDGFRIDAAKHLIEDGQIQENTPETIAWLTDFSAFVKSVKPDAFTVGENAGSGTDALLPYYPDTLDAYFQFELAQQIINASRFGNSRQLSGVVTGAADRIPDDRFATFLANHDQTRLATQLDDNTARQKVAAMLLFSLPGTPFIYYGEEIGMLGDKPDELIRTPMQWSGEDNGGFSSVAPWQPLQPDWQTKHVTAQDADATSLLTTYRTWVHLRVDNPALAHGSLEILESANPNVFLALRAGDEQTILVVINMGGEPSDELTVALPDRPIASATDLLTNEAGVTEPDGSLVIPPLPAQSGTAIELQAPR